MKPKIVLMATGGTIASRYDPSLGSTVASQPADELLKMLPQVAQFAEIEVHDFATIHAARDVAKMHTSAVETFQSFPLGPLGEVDGDAIVVHRRPTLRRSFKVDQLEERVDLVRLVLGIDLRGVEAAIERGIAGLVVEAFGRGNGPSRLTELVRVATGKAVPVLVTSRCATGRVQPIYGGGGGGCDLVAAGGIFVGDLKGAKARLLLMVLLSNPATRDRLADNIAALAP